MKYYWDDIIGHEKSIKQLEKDLESNNLSHAYLFAGPAEVGRYVVAKKFANILICKNDYKINIAGIELEKCNEKVVEQLYEELIRQIKQQIKSGKLKPSKDGKGSPIPQELAEGQFDEHIEGKAMSKEEQKEAKDKWQERMESSFLASKLAGKEPQGIARLIGKLRKNQIDWKILLRRYLKKGLNQSETDWKRANKRYRPFGLHFPREKKFGLDVNCVIDLSGSIGSKELNSFVSEICGIAKQYRKINLRIITHEVDVIDNYWIKNADAKKIIKNLKLNGGGGTSHKAVFDLMKRDYKKNTVAVFLTDNYSDVGEIDMKKYPFEKIFVLTKDGTEEGLNKKFCKILKLK